MAFLCEQWMCSFQHTSKNNSGCYLHNILYQKLFTLFTGQVNFSWKLSPTDAVGLLPLPITMTLSYRYLLSVKFCCSENRLADRAITNVCGGHENNSHILIINPHDKNVDMLEHKLCFTKMRCIACGSFPQFYVVHVTYMNQ